MLQRSYNPHILILHLSNLRDQQPIQIGSPIQANYYIKLKLYALIIFTSRPYFIIQVYILLFSLLKG